MESLQVTRPSFLGPFLPTARRSSPPGVGVQFSRRWINAKPVISKREHAGLRNTRFVVVSHSSGKEIYSYSAQNENPLIKTFRRKLNAFYVFIRPHSIIGTVIGRLSVSILALEKFSDISPLFLTGMFQAIFAAFFMNIFTVALNQLSDIEIDKVNKPYLPLASGEFSINNGVIIAASSAIMSFWLGWNSRPLFWALFAHFAIGVAYSVNVPFLRWKRFPIAFLISCLLGQGVSVQLLYYLHIQTVVFGGPAIFSKAAIFAAAFMSVATTVLMIFKDIPDVEGDKLDGIQTLAILWGSEKVFWICIGLVQIAYLGAIIVGFTSPHNWSKFIIVPVHMLLASMLWRRAKSVNLGSKAETESFYGFLCQLVYAENFLILLVR